MPHWLDSKLCGYKLQKSAKKRGFESLLGVTKVQSLAKERQSVFQQVRRTGPCGKSSQLKQLGGTALDALGVTIQQE
ncbi:MAG TPA: hypothetical protein DCS30_05035 [Rhizobiales bacterium]|nr:hypothetical protein [Hyphomicrobiales bacterium]